MSRYQNIVILTGAGISAESGLSTFRGAGSLWDGHRVQDVATPEAFARDPDLVHEFYNMRRSNLLKVKPNAAHDALSRLEKRHNGSVQIITQNVDDLHKRSGSKNVLHMHGEILKARCRNCHKIFDWKKDLTEETTCPTCQTTPSLRPHIVWFGEMPLKMEEIEVALYTADLFLSIGTSGNVYPAAGFVAEIKNMGKAHSVELNLEPSEGQFLFAEGIYGKATKIVPEFVETLLKENP